MKIEFTRAEIERIILAYANNLVPAKTFNEVEDGYRLPSSVTVAIREKEQDAAQ